jgi:hypothetical protein
MSPRCLGRDDRDRRPSESEQPLDHQDISPGAVEFAVAAMQADRGKATTLDQADARNVVGEELADHLVKAAAPSGGGERFGKLRADSAATHRSIHIDARLPDARVALASL